MRDPYSTEEEEVVAHLLTRFWQAVTLGLLLGVLTLRLWP